MRATMIAIGALAIAGCGGHNATAPVSPTPATEDAVAGALDLTPDGASWISPAGCEVDAILTTSQTVALYAGAGDVVETNPAGTVGVKVPPDAPATCRDELRGQLAAQFG